MPRLKKTGILICLSAMLLASGTYVATEEALVWVGNETDLMHIYTLPFSFPLWISALLLLVFGIISGMQKPAAPAQPRKPFLTTELVVAVALGTLTLASTLLPWVNAETINPTIERPGFGSLNVGQYHALSGVSLIAANYWEGDVVYLVFVGATIAVLYIPLLALLEKRRADPLIAILLLISGACIALPVASVWTTERWATRWSFGGSVGGSAAVFESPGVGLSIAAASAAGLTALGIIAAISSARKRARFVGAV